jgi:hypothetical protein
MEGGAARRNWAAPAGPLAGEEVGEDEGLTYCGFGAEDGRRSADSWPAGGAQGARRGELCSGGLPAWEEARATRAALAGAREGLGAASRMRRHAGVGARRCWPHWHMTDGPGAVACARTGRQRLLWTGRASAAPSHRGDGTTRLQCRGTATDLGGRARQRGGADGPMGARQARLASSDAARGRGKLQGASECSKPREDVASERRGLARALRWWGAARVDARSALERATSCSGVGQLGLPMFD